MIDWIKNLLKNEEPKGILEWETEESFFQHLKRNINEDGSLKESAETLPDEKRADDEIKFVSPHSCGYFCLCQFVPIDLPTNLPVYQVSDDSYNGSIVDRSSTSSTISILKDMTVCSMIRVGLEMRKRTLHSYRLIS